MTIAPSVIIHTIDGGQIKFPASHINRNEEQILPVDPKEVAGIELTPSGAAEHVAFFTGGLYDKFNIRPNKDPAKCVIRKIPNDHQWTTVSDGKILSVGPVYTSHEQLQSYGRNGMACNWDWDNKQFAIYANSMYSEMLFEIEKALRVHDIALFCRGGGFGKSVFMLILSKR